MKIKLKVTSAIIIHFKYIADAKFNPTAIPNKKGTKSSTNGTSPLWLANMTTGLVIKNQSNQDNIKILEIMV